MLTNAETRYENHCWSWGSCYKDLIMRNRGVCASQLRAARGAGVGLVPMSYHEELTGRGDSCFILSLPTSTRRHVWELKVLKNSADLQAISWLGFAPVNTILLNDFTTFALRLNYSAQKGRSPKNKRARYSYSSKGPKIQI